MDFLFDIPILGIFFQLLDYMIQVLTVNGAVILALAAPIALGALCGFMTTVPDPRTSSRCRLR